MRALLHRLSTPLLALGLLACQRPPQQDRLQAYFPAAPGLRTGGVQMIPVQTPKGTFKVWTKRFGHNPRLKVLLLHGGPGSTHEYFESFEGFLPAEGIEFIYYDQLGSARSDQPKDDSLWTTERFVDEVEQVRQALGLTRENFILLGHSWGGILAAEYALKHGQHLKGLVISNMMMDCADYDRYAKEVLAKQMDPAALKEIRDLEARKQYAVPRYMELLQAHYYSKHVCRLPELPEPAARAFAHTNQQVYVLMQGPSEFGLSGRLEGWSRKAELGRLGMPTLVIGAAHDTMDPAHMQWVAGQVPKGSYLHCPDGSHMAMWDDQKTYFPGLLKWLKAVDAGQATVTY